jgi:CoA-transferase family III
MPGPLHGYRVIDLSSMVSGPSATMLLADQGADVIKVENPQGGDHTRAAANRRSGYSASFLNNNRNKRVLVQIRSRPCRPPSGSVLRCRQHRIPDGRRTSIFLITHLAQPARLWYKP